MKISSILILIGGLLIVLNSALAALAYSAGIVPIIPMNVSPSLLLSLSLIGLLAGIVVLLSFYLSLRSVHRQSAGILAIVFCIVGFAGGGGFFLGSILGIIGGVFLLRGK